jgi:hypothetical protein
MEYHYWTEQEKQSLEELSNQGLKDKEIAEKLGRTVDSVCNKRMDLIIIKRDFKNLWKPEDIELLKELNEKGNSQKQMAEILRRTENEISNKRTELGLHCQYGVWKKGYDGEQAAKVFFEKQGYIISQRGKGNTPFDFIVTKAGKTFAVNVTTSDLLHNIASYLDRLQVFGKPVFLIKNGTKWIWFEANIIETIW